MENTDFKVITHMTVYIDDIVSNTPPYVYAKRGDASSRALIIEIRSSKGQVKIKNKYDEIQFDGYYTEENEYTKSGYIVRTTTENGYRYGYYDSEGEQVLKEEYNYIARLTQIKSDTIYLIAAKNGQGKIRVQITHNHDA